MRKPICVFFDVDETVIKIKSMFDFLSFFVAKYKKDGKSLQKRYEIFLFMIKTLKFFNVSRSIINRVYYYFFRNLDEKCILEYGNQWFLLQNKEDLFHQEIIEKIKLHQYHGDIIVFVSGSLFACLSPVAKHLNVEHILCCQQKINKSGSFTGKISFPVIGKGKKKAMNTFLSEKKIDPNICIAYADDVSDLPMLEAVGKAVVIPSSEKLLGIAKKMGWEIINKAPHHG